MVGVARFPLPNSQPNGRCKVYFFFGTTKHINININAKTPSAKPRSQAAKCCFHCKACHICINAMTNLVDYNNPVATALLLPLTTDFSFGIP